MSEEKKQLEVLSEEKFETFVENAIDAFEEKVQKNEYIDEIEEFSNCLKRRIGGMILTFIWKRTNWNSQQKPVIGCGKSK